MFHRSHVALLALALPILGGCPKKAGTATDTAGPTAVASEAALAASGPAPATPKAATPSSRVATLKPFVAAFPVPPFKGAFPHRTDLDVADPGRVVEIAYARAGGESDVAPFFKLTNTSGKTVRVNQTWLFYYDASGKQLERYPHSLSGSLTLAPGESKEYRLGQDIASLKPGTTTYEGEVTSAYFGDEPWFNANLVDERPQGGLPADALVARSGERVIVDVYSLTTYKVRLTNVTDKPVTEEQITLLYYNPKGQTEKRVWTSLLETALQPGQSADVTLKPSFTTDAKPPPKAVSVVGFAWRVDFADSTYFTNENLDSEARRIPVKAK